MMTQSEIWQFFKFKYNIGIRYSDFDMLGHLNNAVYLTYLETARYYYFLEVCDWNWDRPGLAVANTNMDFKLPIMPGDKPRVHLRTIKIGNKSITMENVITDQETDTFYFFASMVLVTIDNETGKSIAIPDQYRRMILEYEPAL